MGETSEANKAAPRLLTGGNPQIPKGDGEEPVQAYIAAMPGWKRAVGQQLDALVTGAVPDLRKAVKWNTPLYGGAAGGWFLAFNCTSRYVKVAFLNGAELTPLPPVESKAPNTRYLHLHEQDRLDEAQFLQWLEQASARPGARM
ncbi:DUF1801 domain-containing protein [Phenylobacterium deserti]|uniref:DUF1801 domain-containing protein n=1 Tax=Phenylobacterium deserti TaxID=1914756 RepID=A0A328AQ83_9CAUL|nr:DUF1801 domain-containing protein [Phenylobacterium deserti]RAK56515.1 DUF1801 domain-containing protein [Phenylobacterium deserti]